MGLALVIIIIIISTAISEIYGLARVTLYTERGHKGQTYKLPRNWMRTNCLNLPEWISNNVEAVETAGQCVVICSKEDCRGKCEAIFPGEDSKESWFGDLHELQLDNAVMSVRKCW